MNRQPPAYLTDPNYLRATAAYELMKADGWEASLRLTNGQTWSCMAWKPVGGAWPQCGNLHYSDNPLEAFKMAVWTATTGEKNRHVFLFDEPPPEVAEVFAKYGLLETTDAIRSPTPQPFTAS